MDDRAVFDTYLQLLRRIVALRGGDPAAESARYCWPGGVAETPEPPKAAMSLSPLLTGGPQPGHVEAPSHTGVVAVPSGLRPPKP
jgi:hypothetical protein